MKEQALKKLGEAFLECQKQGFRLSAFGDALIIINIKDKKRSIIMPDGKIFNLGRECTRFNFDEDGMII